MKYNYSVTFYEPGDDGSHPFGDYELRFDTPEEAFAYADEKVNEDWSKRFQSCKKIGTERAEWFLKHGEKIITVVEIHRVP